MLNFIGLLFFLTKFQASVNAAAYILPSQEKPPGFECLKGCYVPSPVNNVLAFNETFYTKDECSKYVCNADGTTYYESCGVLAPPTGCKVLTDNTQQYPKCCPSVVCPPKPRPIPRPRPCICPVAQTAVAPDIDNESAQPLSSDIWRPCKCRPLPRPIVDTAVDPDVQTS